MTKLERPRTLVEMATEKIRDMIVAGRLSLGQRVSENQLAEELGISTTPVREAFSNLARQGLLTIAPQKGTYVFTLASGELNQLCELRGALEPVAMRLAAERFPEQLVARLAAIVTAMDEALARKDIPFYLSLDTAFHDALLASCGNPYLVGAYDLISAKVATLRYKLGTDPHHVAKSHREHRRILEAIRAKRISNAIEILYGHIARKEGSYWEHLKE